jgi:hypothetical protein
MAYGTDNPIIQGFQGEMKHYYHPQRFGGYRLLTDERLIESVMAGPRYTRACEWVRGCRKSAEETDYCKMLFRELEQQTPNGIMLECRENIITQFEGFRALFESIRDNGFKPLGYVYSIFNHYTNCRYYYGDINLRHVEGHLDFGDGRHRIAILLALNQPVYYIEVEH